MSRFFILRVLPLSMVLVLLCTVVAPFIAENVNAWSGVVGNATHQDIDRMALAIMGNQPRGANVNFPTLQAIQANDFVLVTNRTGPGPDVPGASLAGDHYYNPRIANDTGAQSRKVSAGGGPDAVKTEYLRLVNALAGGKSAEAARAAAWVAHFASDLTMPYHTQGTTRADIMRIWDAAGGEVASSIPLPAYITGPLGLSPGVIFNRSNDFKSEIRAFLNGTRAFVNTEDWFDPWYWDGRLRLTMEESTHVMYEAKTFIFPDAPTAYSEMWQNAAPSFDNYKTNQAAQVRNLAINTARVTQGMVDSGNGVGYISAASPYLEPAIRAAATVWRASFSALVPSISFSIPDKNEPQKLKVKGMVLNTSGDIAKNVYFRITITGGTLKSRDVTHYVGDVGSTVQKSYTWDVEAAKLGYCTVKLEVIGEFKTPDLQYAVTELAAPGILPVTVAEPSTAPRAHSIVFCLDNSDSMQGQPVIDAAHAGVQAVDAASFARVEMGVYHFGQNACGAAMRVLDFTINKDAVKSAINKAAAFRGISGTNLAQAITDAGAYIRISAKGEKATIILLTDGVETCGGDPVAAARALNPNVNIKINRNPFVTSVYAANSIPIKLDVVGFNIASLDDEKVLKAIAQAGNGDYYSADNVQELNAALTEVIKKSSQQGIVIQMWWLLVGGGVLLLILVITLASRRRARLALLTREQDVVTGPVTAYPYIQVPSPPIIAPPALFCPRCGLQAQLGASFCLKCGTSLAVTTEPVPNPAVAGHVYCPRCGTANTVGSAFCNRCGTSLPPPLAVVVSAPTAALVYCPRCGKANTQGSAFCNTCGTRILPVAQPPAAVTPRTVKEKKASWAWWFLVLLLLPGGLIAYFALKKEHPDLAKKILIFTTTLTFLIAAANMPAIAELLGK